MISRLGWTSCSRRPLGTASFTHANWCARRQRRNQNLSRFDRFGYLLGDDVLNLIGDVGRYGKEIDGDLWEGKWTIVARARSRTMPINLIAWISSSLVRPRERRLPRKILRLHRILASSGSIQWAQQSAATFAERFHPVNAECPFCHQNPSALQ
jgi:geranylgeranyl pyrophosphate synthase